MSVIDPAGLPVKEIRPGWKARFFHSESMTFAHYEIAADAVPVHEHRHPQEEVWNLLEGELAITIGGTEHVARPGCAAIVPPNIPHSARVLGACRAIIVDHPLRHEVGGVSTID